MARETHRILTSPTVETPLLPWLLVALAPMNRTRVKEVLRSGRVCVNGLSCTRHDTPVNPGDRLTVAHQRPTAAPAPLPIVYQDDVLIVLDKPVGWLTVSTEEEKSDTAFSRLTASLGTKPFVVHRIDRETSGLLVFARTAEAQTRLQACWDRATKTYLAIVEGTPAVSEGVIENYLVEDSHLNVWAHAREVPGSKLAVSRYRVVETRRKLSLVEVRIETGRKHQIRVHLAGLGCTVIGDTRYRAKTDPAERLGLHAWRLAFDHPVTGERLKLEAPWPRELAKLIQVL